MFTDQDSLADIEFEHNRIKCNEEQISAVNFMKDMIKLGATGIELANNKFKLLRLNRWSSDVTAEMDRYDRPLSKIYQRYWRKGSVSPFVELAVLLFGGLIFHHFKNVLFGVGGNQPRSEPLRAAAPARACRRRNVPFSMPQPRGGEAADHATAETGGRRPATVGAAGPAMPAPNLTACSFQSSRRFNSPEGPQGTARQTLPPSVPSVVIDVQPRGPGSRSRPWKSSRRNASPTTSSTSRRTAPAGRRRGHRHGPVLRHGGRSRQWRRQNPIAQLEPLSFGVDGERGFFFSIP